MDDPKVFGVELPPLQQHLVSHQVRSSVDNYHKCATVANARLSVQLRSSPVTTPDAAKTFVCEAIKEFVETCSQNFATCYDYRELVIGN